MEQTELRPKIEIVRVPSIERARFRPLDGVQLRAAYSHVRVGTYCPEPPRPEPASPSKPPEHSRKHKKNLGPVSRLLRRRHNATSLATKSCDNIYSVNKSNSFFDWKHGHSIQAGRQSNSLDWRVGQRIDKSPNNLDCRKASRSAEQLSRSGTLQASSTKSKLVSLLKRLSPRLPRPSSKGSLPSSPSLCPWLQVEYSSPGPQDSQSPQLSPADPDLGFQRELQLSEQRKRAITGSSSKQEIANDGPLVEQKKNPRSSSQPNVQVQEKPDSCPSYRAVHEDRGGGGGGPEERRVPVVGGAPEPHARRSRPHSLAVQPLNYQRLDPELLLEQQQQQQPPPPPSRRPVLQARHANMTSQESIGSCSLDVDKSASDRSDVNAGSLSEKTLHSLNLSINGCEEGAGLVVSNGHEEARPAGEDEPGASGEQPEDDEQLTSAASHKKPSYLGLACSISGYSGITRYDSKLREGFRSRDSSPGARLITRDTSPAAFRSNPESLSVLSSRGPSISPLAMDRQQQNGWANGVRDARRIESYGTETGRGMSNQGYSEVDRAAPPSSQLSPIRASSPNKRSSPVAARVAAYNQHNSSFSSTITTSSPKSLTHNVSHSSYSETSVLNGSLEHVISLNSSSQSEKSFIQQRVERLYGPGALAQGFFFKRSSSNSSRLDTSNLSDKSRSSNNNNTSVDDSNADLDESLKNLPVLRHLTPQFRAQLPVVSPRRPTDGTEQIIKPLKRISLSSVKNDAKETKASTETEEQNDATIDSKMTASVTSLTDQQPAAPKVVLPVLEPSGSLTNIPKQGVEAPAVVLEKDGHYFINLLSKERDRLIILAEGAEAELAGTGATDIPEEAAGKLRSAAGKARLLATQKMKQFEGLCQKNINQVPGEAFPTTSEDLAGFWDMVMLQVVQVNDIFELIEKSKKSHWQEILPESKSMPSTPQNGSSMKRRQTPASKMKSTPANNEAARKAREAREQTRRQLIEERRRAMRSNANNSDSAVEIFVPET